MLARRLRAISGARPLTLISSSEKQETSSSTSLVITKPSNVQSGDLLVAIVSVGSGSAASDNIWSASGWTRGFDKIGRAALYRVADGSEGSSITFTASGLSGTHHGWIFNFRNASWGGTSSDLSALATNVTLTNVTGLTNAYGMVIADKSNGAGTTYTIDDGTYTSLAVDSDGTQPSSRIWYKTPVSQSGTPTITGSSNFRAYFVYLNPV